jgi:hypothetical protein
MRVAVRKTPWMVSLLLEKSVAILTGDTGVDLIAETHETIQGCDVASSQSLCRWNSLEDDMGHLERIVEDLRQRDRASRQLTDNDDGPVGDSYLLPTPQDPGLYRVRVRVRMINNSDRSHTHPYV